MLDVGRQQVAEVNQGPVRTVEVAERTSVAVVAPANSPHIGRRYRARGCRNEAGLELIPLVPVEMPGTETDVGPWRAEDPYVVRAERGYPCDLAHDRPGLRDRPRRAVPPQGVRVVA